MVMPPMPASMVSVPLASAWLTAAGPAAAGPASADAATTGAAAAGGAGTAAITEGTAGCDPRLQPFDLVLELLNVARALSAGWNAEQTERGS
jgi:hypothetical protein